ncbi:uncharacterized protein [Palaemon carinicauda]|uniref:uncharacterized protein n=1 Tax=Palaemon carinicauda TaxID=392227 RepID=UPI0035B62562
MDPIFLCEFCGGYMGDENQLPRVLSCGHTFCSQCINDFFKNCKFECFKCRSTHHTKRPGRIPANHTLLKIIKAKESPYSGPIDMPLGQIKDADLARYRKPQSSCSGQKSIRISKTLEEPEQHAGKCDKHALYCKLWCKRCKEWICKDCTLVNHPPMRCHVLSFTEAIKEIKLDEDSCIRRTVQLFDRHVVIYREKLCTLRDMNEKHRSLIQDLQNLVSKYQKLDMEIEKREVTIQESLATGLSMLLMLLESQGHLLKAKDLREVLLSRQSAQGCQSAILGWYEPRLLEDTEEIVISDYLQRGTMGALAVLKHSMALSFNQRLVEESNGFTSLPENDQEGLVIYLKRMMESPYWKNIIERTEGEDTVEGNSMYRLAQGTRKVDTRLRDFNFSKERNFRATYRFGTNQNVRVEKLIDTDDDEWYQKFRNLRVLTNKRKVSLRPFSPVSLLEEITDDCYSQFKDIMSKIALSADGAIEYKALKQVKAPPRHMIPLTPMKEGREFKLGVSGNSTSRDKKILSKESVMKLLNTEGQGRDMKADSEKKETDYIFTTNSSKSNAKISNTKGPSVKAVPIYPEWEGNHHPSINMSHPFKSLSHSHTIDSIESDSNASVRKDSQDNAHDHESFGEEESKSRSTVVESEAYEDSENTDTDTFVNNGEREDTQTAKGRNDVKVKSSNSKDEIDTNGENERDN